MACGSSLETVALGITSQRPLRSHPKARCARPDPLRESLRESGWFGLVGPGPAHRTVHVCPTWHGEVTLGNRKGPDPLDQGPQLLGST